jgi:hypothetical protein
MPARTRPAREISPDIRLIQFFSRNQFHDQQARPIAKRHTSLARGQFEFRSDLMRGSPFEMSKGIGYALSAVMAPIIRGWTRRLYKAAAVCRTSIQPGKRSVSRLRRLQICKHSTAGKPTYSTLVRRTRRRATVFFLDDQRFRRVRSVNVDSTSHPATVAHRECVPGGLRRESVRLERVL